MLRFFCTIVLACLSLPGCRATPSEATPIRYSDIDVSAVFDEVRDAELTTKWTLEFAPAPDGDRIFVLPAGGESFNRYGDISASLVREREAPQPLQVLQNRVRPKNLNGERYSVSVPAIKLPATAPGDRIVVLFRTSQKKQEAIHWLPAGEVVNAHVTVKARGNTPRTASFGFESRGIERQGAWSVERLAMRSESGNPRTRSGESAPYVAMSTLSQWSNAWKTEANAFRDELAKPLALTGAARAGGRALPSFDARTAEEKERLAKDLYRWVVQEFKYDAAGLDPLYSTAPRPIEDTWKRRTGDCKDLGLVYIKLLQLAGIAAEPVLVPFLDDKYLPKKSLVPTILLFNHLIVYLPEFDEYLDLTAGPKDKTGAVSASYAGVFGGHMFSGEYRMIMPDKRQSHVKVATRIKKQDGVWVGETTWNGQGLGRLKVINARDLLRDRMNGSDNPKFINDMEMILVPGSWAEHRGPGGEETASFGFQLRTPATDSHGQLVQLPRVFSGGNLLRYTVKSDIGNIVVAPCYRIEGSEEVLSIEGVSRADLGRFAKVDIQRHGLSFSQNIEVNNGRLQLERRLDIDERRVACSPQDANQQRAYFAEVRALIEATADHLKLGAP